jgi:hypothetical protein
MNALAMVEQCGRQQRGTDGWRPPESVECCGAGECLPEPPMGYPDAIPLPPVGLEAWA